MSDPLNPDVDYTLMESGPMVCACGDSGARWARAFVQHMAKQGQPNIDEGLMIAWFANIIETSYSVRTERAVTELVDSIKRGTANDQTDGEWADGVLERAADRYGGIDAYARYINSIPDGATPVPHDAAATEDVAADTGSPVQVQITELHSDDRARSREQEVGRGDGQVRRPGYLRNLLARLGVVGL
jgi:hypothetical protein